MNIGSSNDYPSCALSNFAPHPFVIDGVECNSMEGFLQSLKFRNVDIQVEVCKLVGFGAKRRGSGKNKTWKRVQLLWWRGQEYKRDSQEYQDLLDRAFDELSKNTGFQRALLATGNATLTHTMGKQKTADTVLTIKEFCGRLERIRTRLQKGDKQ